MSCLKKKNVLKFKGFQIYSILSTCIKPMLQLFNDYRLGVIYLFLSKYQKSLAANKNILIIYIMSLRSHQHVRWHFSHIFYKKVHDKK